MAEHRICPWWVGYLLASPVRRLFQDPARILAPYVRPGMLVFEPGPGMGFFTLEMARLVGPAGRVVAVDVQPRMIEALKRRADRAGVLDRIDARLSRPNTMGIDDLAGKVDFAFAFAVVHELPRSLPFFPQTARALKAGGKLFLAEPAGHVGEAEFSDELAAATQAGLSVIDRPALHRSQTAVLAK